ncbi:MAG: hypothetical protein KME01_06145 [Chroococcus sp. CMT-3BRIN-NPC107]|jgi:hypothetical protein|nr:hypothetical protein [Chroococcus sp. CMT-3BRIN-NPC107]
MGSYLNILIKSCLMSFGIAVLLPLNLPAFAETKILNLSLKTDENQSFASLIQQAELTAINLINQEFERSSKVTKIGIIISGERNGQEVPLLSTKVSQTNWQAQPKIQSWTNYFAKAAILLGFNPPPKLQPNLPISVNLSSVERNPAVRDD